MAEKSKILLIGGTGYIGKFIVEARVKAGHRTFALLRDSTLSSPAKSKIIQNFISLGVNILIRFIPSEFGNDVYRSHCVGPAKTASATKANIRRAVEAAGIPYTYVSSNVFAGYFLPSLSQLAATAPPRDKIFIFGNGNPKTIFNKEDDIGTYTIKAIDDPRTLNKILYIRPPGNIYSFNDLVSLWEKKIGKTLERIYFPEDQLLKNIKGHFIN